MRQEFKTGDYIRNKVTGERRLIGERCLLSTSPKQIFGGSAYYLHGEGIHTEHGLRASIGYIEQQYVHDKEFKVQQLLKEVDGL